MIQGPRRTVALVAGLALYLVACTGPTVELLDPTRAKPDATAPQVDAGQTTLDGGGVGETDARTPTPQIPGLLALRIEPSERTIVDDGKLPAETAMLKAIGTFASGERDVTAEVGWSIADARLGSAQAGVVKSASVGGKTRVVARAEGHTAKADVTFLLDIFLLAEGAPAGLDDLFSSDLTADVVDNASLRVVYPSNETMFPLNLGRVNHQWRATPGLDAFELRFESELASVRVYTDHTSHTTNAELWEWLAKTHAGKSLSFRVRGTSRSNPSVVYRTRPFTFHYSESEALGAIYYWSTGAQGVMRAKISSGNASRFFPAAGDVTCAACHTVSRDGRRLAIGYDGENLRQVSVPDAALEIPAKQTDVGPSYGWGTYNPGATRLLYASKGKLSLLDAETGKKLKDVALPKDMLVNFPDWSPDGKWVVLAVKTGGKMGNKDATGTSLARIPVLAGDAFGEPEIILASATAEDTFCFPMFAPDSQTIAFVRTTGKSKDNPTARIFLLPADGSKPPQALARLNQRVGAADIALDVGNTMPTWAPTTTERTYWLAFSSLRDYGDLLVGQAREQIWAAALDATKIGGPEDPSFAAFWLPFQQLEEHNHRAFWALAPEQECTPAIEICDSLDNDCDGQTDEAGCCIPQPELCDNDLDDDCDGTINESCSCASTETCGNGVDDDCDGLTDKQDEDCTVVL